MNSPAFQACIKLLLKGGKTSNEILKAALEKARKSTDIDYGIIPHDAEPEEINNTLKKTIEAVVGSLEGHKAGFFKSNPGKPEALKELAELRKLANSDDINLKKLDDSLKIMEEFRDGSPKYNDYQSNVSILRGLLGSINSRKQAEEDGSKIPNGPRPSLLLGRVNSFKNPNPSEEEQIKAAVRNSLHDKAIASKEQPYDSGQVHSSLELYRRKYEHTYSNKVRISSDFPILSEALIRKSKPPERLSFRPRK